MTLPYSDATSGTKAIEEVRRILQSFGCGKFAPMEDFTKNEVTMQFQYRGRMVQVTASARGYARAWLRENPHTHRMRKSATEHERAALAKGQIAVWSILRDWIKGQITAAECAEWWGQAEVDRLTTAAQEWWEEQGMAEAAEANAASRADDARDARMDY